MAKTTDPTVPVSKGATPSPEGLVVCISRILGELTPSISQSFSSCIDTRVTSALGLASTLSNATAPRPPVALARTDLLAIAWDVGVGGLS